ncbi:MAG: PSD1 and planctomycete cytochrome C domain-containing protein [Gemmataceae bacterium]|nr:PSD1 and planctomycete cytochrome C domain-containing protein [Gemmataceae bacterium]MCI0739010.1 PSD1 and planctomycete cytochrome C domain-containing protein [Gemmataceae bacterium]
MKRNLGFCMLVCCTILWGASVAHADDKVDFTREVRPILSRYCFKCHGPDESTRKAKLRFDVREKAVEKVIVPGQPDDSELVARVFAEKASKRMPPASTKMELTEKQKQILKRWIAEGAEYQPHWAFVPPKQAPLPACKQKDWPRNSIDHFILARLEASGLRPSPLADLYTLLRRASLDLVGLPPTLEEVDAVLAEVGPMENPTYETKFQAAYEKFVDRLLASKQYGERWARRWLDLARYADTNGYEKDRQRIIWPYRDWVIQALNADMPFDQFTIEQIAGDMLPKPTPDQIVATGFHRNTMINEEGGIDPLEFRYYAVVDRANTTGTVWLGLTLGCAQCHTHKYDPVPQREYYQLLAFLNNADEPDYEIPNADIAKRRAGIETRIADLEAKIADKFPGGVEAQNKSLAEWDENESAKAVTWRVLRPAAMKTNMAFLQMLDDGSILASGDQTKSDTYELTFKDKLRGVTALRLEVLPDENLPARGPGRAYYEGPKGDFFLSELSATMGGQKVSFSGGSHSHANGGFGAGKVGAQYCFDGQAGTGWSTTDQPGKPHSAVFNFAAPVDLDDGMALTMIFERHYSCGLGRFRISATTDVKKAAATGHGAELESILAKAAQDRSEKEKQKVLRRFLHVTPALAEPRKEIEKLRASLPAYQTTMVMKERPKHNPRSTHIHHRGEFLEPRDQVQAGVLSILQPFPKDAPRDRLGLARWLVSPDNPLTARVTVNRQWQAFFGRGLVRTTEDFGLQGEFPTHPELLDWLAVEFVKQGWSIKKLHKLIVMSATYQQAARATPEHLEKDAENKLLARGPRVRLEAEMIRDSLLRSSGLLSAKQGGPSVFPPQPSSVTTEGVYGAIQWKPSAGEDRYRRGLYTFLKRSIPYAMFATFDGVTGEVCQARREVSNTPLQALTMLNDVVVMEAAQTLGKKTAEASGSVEERMRLLFRQVLTRPPTQPELTALVDFQRRQRERLQSGALNAKQIAGGDDANAVERAAWTLVARSLFNLDEMVTK